jgi:hypothetical protein
MGDGIVLSNLQCPWPHITSTIYANSSPDGRHSAACAGRGSSALRSESAKRIYRMHASRLTSGLVLKLRNGEYLVVFGRVKPACPLQPQLTAPLIRSRRQDHADPCQSKTVAMPCWIVMRVRYLSDSVA